MLTAFTNEATTWLGYLQRGSVLIQVALFVVAVAAEARLKRRLQSPLLSSASYLVTPLLVLVVSSVLLALRIPAGLLRYFSLLWLIWRAVEPSKLLLQKRFPKAPLDEIEELTVVGSQLERRRLVAERREGFKMRDDWVQKDERLRRLIAEANELAPTSLTEEEIQDLLAFLESLSDDETVDLASLVPKRVPSGLPVDD